MEKFARTIKLAAKIREESFDQARLNTIKATNIDITGIDMNQFYTISLYVACNQAIEKTGYDEQGIMPIYFLLKNSWNDVLDWATIICPEK